MSNPSFSNIDLWLFELAEGNLSPEQVKQLELFLLNHPELDVERDVWEMAKVDKQAVAYPHMADLTKSRRPAAVMALAGLVLLLLGSGSYIAWNINSEGFTEADLTVQNEHVKGELLRQIRLSKNAELSNAVNESKTDNSNGVHLENTSAHEVAQNSSQDAAFIASNTGNSNSESQFRTGNTARNNNYTVDGVNYNLNQNFNMGSDGSLNLANLQSSYSNPRVTNLAYNSYDNELDEELGNSDEVGNKEFFVREPREFEFKEGRVWIERKSTISGQAVTASEGDRNLFKSRFSKFTRSLERMMNSPIALKNSRDPHYQVPGMTPSDINFSSVGTLISTRVQATSRVQWLGKENEQLMNQLSIDGYAHEIRGGLGLQLNHQLYKDGGLQVAQAAITYSPKISVSNWVSVEPSVRIKMGNKRLNADRMEDIDMVELDRGNAREFYPNGATPIGRNLWYKDLGVGLLVNTKWFFAGVQTDNLFKHKDNVYDNNWSDPRRAQNHFTATIGSDWVSRYEDLALSPYIVYQKNEQLSEVWAGANFKYEWFNIGVAASSNLEPAASIGMKFDHFSMHYNADYTHSEMLGKKALSHQLTVRFVAKQSRYKNQIFKR